MINGKTILAIIPARGGSKGIPRKNIKNLAGKPLIAWSIEEAKKSKYIDRLILSSEDDEIIEVAKKWKCEVPFKRPMELAQDETPGIEPVLHAIKTLPEKYDFACLLQPTSPLRKVEHIDTCIEKCINNNAESCISVSEAVKHPYWMFKKSDDEYLIPLLEKLSIKRRQDLPKVYSVNGAIYLASMDQILREKSFFLNNTLGFEMNKINSVDLDDEVDFLVAERILEMRVVKLNQ